VGKDPGYAVGDIAADIPGNQEAVDQQLALSLTVHKRRSGALDRG